MASTTRRTTLGQTVGFVLLGLTLWFGWYNVWFSIAGDHPRYEPARWWNFNSAYVLLWSALATVIWTIVFSSSVNPDNKTWHKYAELIARTLIALCVGAFFSAVGLTDAKMWIYFIGVVLLGIASGIANYRFRTGPLWNGMFSLAAGYAFGFWSFVITLVAGGLIMWLTDSALDEASNPDTAVG